MTGKGGQALGTRALHGGGSWGTAKWTGKKGRGENVKVGLDVTGGKVTNRWSPKPGCTPWRHRPRWPSRSSPRFPQATPMTDTPTWNVTGVA